MGVKRKTKGVETILELFKDSNDGITVVSLVDRLQGQMNKTTVYRILERLEDEGILHSFASSDGVKCYARCNGCSSGHHDDIHPHFQCNSCGKVTCLSIDIQMPKVKNFQIDSADILFKGQCSDCVQG